MGYKRYRLDERVSLIQETGVAKFMRCNIWHVRGRDCDLVIDTGMGLDPLNAWISESTDRPIKAVVTHSHFNHSGCLHEFHTRLGHRMEADILANPVNESVVYSDAWTQLAIVDPNQHPNYDARTYHITAAPLTGYLDEGDVLDLGDLAFQILHLPGHSPGSIGLMDVKRKVLFTGDALYDGELLDNLYHSDTRDYLRTLERIESLDVDTFHAGHFLSFGREGMQSLINRYRAGNNTLVDVEQCLADNSRGVDIFSDQNGDGIIPPCR